MTADGRASVIDVDVALDAHAEVGEGPVWDAGRERLVWVDIYRDAVHLFDPATGADQAIDVGQHVGVARPAASGGLVLAVRDGFAHLDPATGRIELLAAVEADVPGNLMNDGACDRRGRFLAGTTSVEETPGAGALYRLTADLTVQIVLAGVTLSNGIDWSPDGTLLYFVDSALQRIEAFDYAADGGVSGRRTFAEIPPGAGMPDGLTVDVEGCVWVALWGGSAVRRYTPRGELERTVDVPAQLVTSCAFGGTDLEDLYITTSTWELDAAALRDQPHAGAVFVARPGVRGLLPTPFADTEGS